MTQGSPAISAAHKKKRFLSQIPTHLFGFGTIFEKNKTKQTDR